MKRVIIDTSKMQYNGRSFKIIISKEELLIKFKALQKDIRRTLLKKKKKV